MYICRGKKTILSSKPLQTIFEIMIMDNIVC